MSAEHLSTKSPKAAPLSALQLLDKLEGTLITIQYGETPLELYEPISYLMGLGGKRLRPALVLLAGQLFGHVQEDWLRPALAIEVFHNFTLMHDDIMDKAPLRRGKPTVHHQWNDNVAILSGDVMLVAAYNLLLTVPDAKLRPALLGFNKVASEVCEGQQWDMNFEHLTTVTDQQYLDMIKLKTAVLLGYSCRLGALLADATSEEADLLDQFGTTIGIGFQLMDDILDVYGEQASFGKQVGGDIVANKKTYLLIKALELAEEQGGTKRALNRALTTDMPAAEKVALVTSIYNELGIKQLAEAKMRQYYDEGLAMLDQLPTINQVAKDQLVDFALTLMRRQR